MNNEPVAWMSQGGDVSRSKDYFEEMGFKDLIPLYIHPTKTLTDAEFDKIFADGKRLGVLETEDKFCKAKTLTDDEIISIADVGEWHKDEFAIDFARAILKKTACVMNP